MISCLLIQVSRNRQSLPVCRESVIAGESIQIGRGAACRIRLPDHRVGLLHATLKRSEDGALYIEEENDAPINVNGFIAQSAALSPGARVEIGPYLIIVEPKPDGHDIALSVEMIHPLPERDAAQACRTAPVTLAALGLSKRKLGFGLAACILFAFLLLPLLPGASPAFDKWQATLPVTLNESWKPGPFSDGHGVFGAKCSTCHQRAFRAVSDETCAGCHKRVARHLADDDLHAKTFKDVRCTDCHQDHRGKAGLVLHSPSACVACHGNIESKKADTALDDVHDFGTDHPPFHITLQDGKNVVRVRQDAKEKLAEKPGLKLNHQVHLDKKGLLSPKGNTVMVCRDCHRIEESGIHFAPMTMKETCQQSQCHEIEPGGNNDVPWKIAPLHINRDYQPGAVFPHSKHDTVDCTDCHDKMNSKPSAEIAMPTIEKCRECHTGERSAKGKIGSACDSCHRFHQGAKKASNPEKHR